MPEAVDAPPTSRSTTVTVEDAADADTALLQVARHRPDIVVLDVNLGGPVTGVDLIPLLRSSVPTCRIILYTATPLGHDRSCADAVVLKTATDDLMRVLAALITP